MTGTVGLLGQWTPRVAAEFDRGLDEAQSSQPIGYDVALTHSVAAAMRFPSFQCGRGFTVWPILENRPWARGAIQTDAAMRTRILESERSDEL